MSEIEIRDAKQSVWTGWRGPAIAAAALGLVISGWFTTKFLLQLQMLDTSHTMEREIEASNELFDAYAPEDLSLVWASYEEVGLRQQFVPDFERLRRYALARKYLALINGSVAAAFLMMVVGIWFSAFRAKKRLATSPPS
jgi:type IV secretory pathway TrbD component